MITNTANAPAAPRNGTQAPAQPSQTKRMALSAVTRGVIEKPLKILIHGYSGVGKTTFAASAAYPIFIPVEDGTNSLDVARFPKPATFGELIEALDALIREEHTYRTVVIDTLDAAEPLIFRAVCEAAGKKSISDFPHGQGYVAAMDLYRILIARLELLMERRGMWVILIAHSTIKTFANPSGPDFDRWQLKLNEKAGNLVVEWCDDVLFAQFETFAVEQKGGGKAKGVTGARVLQTSETAAFKAKNRHSLPPSLPLNWEDFYSAVMAHRPADPTKLKEEILQLLAGLEAGKDYDQAKLDDALMKSADNAAALAQLKDRLAAKAAQKEG